MNSINVVLIGAGIASATLGVLLRELNPKINITIFERLDDIAKESSFALNNAGTGHAGYCELNYTPETKNDRLDISKALAINAGFQSTLHLLATLVKEGKIKNPEDFITKTPHSSLVWGKSATNYLKKRFTEMQKYPCFKDIKFSCDKDEIKSWAPLCIESSQKQDFSATKIDYGTDINFGEIARKFIEYLAKIPGFKLELNTQVDNLTQKNNSSWTIDYKNLKTKNSGSINTDFVFLGAGGASLSLLQKSRLALAKNYGGFPVGAQWLLCENPQIVKRHNIKVYSKAPIDELPMSMPHLDRRNIKGKNFLLFGPYAEFTTKFLKKGSVFDLFKSINAENFLPMLQVGFKNSNLINYLMQEVTKTRSEKFKRLLDFYPNAADLDWQLLSGGERVQIVKRHSYFGGDLILGTEVLSAPDKTLAAFLGASPGASVIADSMIKVIESCFAHKLSKNWRQRLTQLVPVYKEASLDVKNLTSLDEHKFLDLQNQALETLKISAS